MKKTFEKTELVEAVEFGEIGVKPQDIVVTLKGLGKVLLKHVSPEALECLLRASNPDAHFNQQIKAYHSVQGEAEASAFLATIPEPIAEKEETAVPVKSKKAKKHE